jgi:hypothetical protein
MKEIRMFVLIMIALLAVTGCSAGSGASPDSNSDPGERSKIGTERDRTSPRDSVFQPADGVVIFKGTERDLKPVSGMITIHGDQGRPWKVIDHNDDSLESLTGEAGDFYPLMFSNGANRDFDIQMRAVRRSKEWIEVVVHETRDPNTLGYVRSDDPLFKFQSWDEWVLDHFNIRFDADSNPVLEAPEGKRKTVLIPREPLIRPAEVRGDWLLVRWTKHEPDEPDVAEIAKAHPENSGWIRWRRDGRILIKEYYP